MTAEQLAALIRAEGLETVARAVHDFARQFVAAINKGWNLTDWRVDLTGGAALFSPIDGRGARVLCLNAPESERATWEAELWRWDTEGTETHPDTILLMTPH